MAGLNAHHRPSASLASKILLLLTALPLFLATLSFVLQWRGGVDVRASRWTAESQNFAGMENSPVSSSVPSSTPGHLSSSSVDCVGILGQSSFPSFPYYRGRNFSSESDPHPKISIVATTSASLEQILPWLFYHKVIGVTQFFLFVEGKAAKPHVSAVLGSISGVKLIHRTKHLVEKQAQRLAYFTFYSSTPYQVVPGQEPISTKKQSFFSPCKSPQYHT